jgi:hypothetical protein
MVQNLRHEFTYKGSNMNSDINFRYKGLDTIQQGIQISYANSDTKVLG